MKKALIIIGAVIALILIVAAVLPSTAHVERTITINAPVELVFDQVNDLTKNFNWSPWDDYDPEMKVEWGEIKSGLGASYSWTGNSDVGSGTMTITESVENQLVKNALDFGDMGKGTATFTFASGPEEKDEKGNITNKTDVVWSMESELGWPIGRYFGLFMDGMVGPDFEKGLNSLKEVAEALPVVPKIMVNEVDVAEMTIIAMKDSVAMADIGPRMGEMYGTLIPVLEANKLEMTAAPMCRYHVWNEEGGYTVLEAGLPVPAGSKVKSNKAGISVQVIPACKAAKVVHMGSYEDLGRVHYAIDEWITSNKKQMAGAPWEIYLTDPETEKDTSKWVTEVYYPVMPAQ